MSAKSAIDRAAATPDYLAAPGPTFDHPSDVLACVETPAAERRAILAAWASDARAVENAPHLRQLENGARVAVSEILDALRRLDAEGADRRPSPASPAAERRAAISGETMLLVRLGGASSWCNKVGIIAQLAAGGLRRVNAPRAEAAYLALEG